MSLCCTIFFSTTMKALRGCFTWLALYALVSLALAAVVERRIGERGPAIAAGLVAGAIASVAFSHLFTFGRSLRELMLIRSAQAGAEPMDGKLFAAIGPFTPDQAEGVLPGTIRCGVQPLRVLVEPDVKIVHTAAKPGAEVCAIGRYSMDRRALFLDRNLEAAAGLFGRRLSAIGSSLMNVGIMTTIVVTAFTAFFAAVPLDFAEERIAGLHPSWLEIGAEDWVETNVRTPLVAAGMPMFFPAEPGASLQPGEARGRIRSGEQEANVTRASAERSGEEIVIRFYDGDRQAGVMTIAPDGVLTALSLFTEDIDPEAGKLVKLVFRKVASDQVAGRVSLVKEGVPVCRVVFRVET